MPVAPPPKRNNTVLIVLLAVGIAITDASGMLKLSGSDLTLSIPGLSDTVLPLGGVSYPRVVVEPLGRRRAGRKRGVSGLRFWSGAVVVTGLMILLLGVDARVWYDEEYLAAHGVTTTAVVDNLRTTRYGVTAFVHFTPPGREQVDTFVHDPPDTPRLEPGSPLLVRYDPDDPAGLIRPVGTDDTVTRWGLLGICALVLFLNSRAIVRRLRHVYRWDS